jgi:hypothetical protein
MSMLEINEKGGYSLVEGGGSGNRKNALPLSDARQKRLDATKESSLPYSFTYKIRQAFVGEKCPICGTIMGIAEPDPDGSPILVDNPIPSIQHNIPISKGGKHEIDNISVICQKCNYKIQDQITGPLNNELVRAKWAEIGNVSGMDTQIRLDKISIDKIRLDKNIEDKSSMSADTDTKTPLINYSSILKYWNERSLLKEITAITDKRKSNLHARIKEHGVEAIFKMIDQVKNSSFLRGNNKQSWTANFDWCIRPNNFVKVLEGNYLDTSKKGETLEEQVDRKVKAMNEKLGIFEEKEPERYV